MADSFEDVINALGRITVVMQNGSPESCMKAAEAIKEVAQELAAVDTGYMRDHITAKQLPDGAQVESEAGYSGFVEYGTVKMRAQPFFRPAIDTVLWGQIVANDILRAMGLA